MATWWDLAKTILRGPLPESGPFLPHEPVRPETQVYNPLNLKVGSSLTIDQIDLRGNTFTVIGIRELVRNINDREFKTTDYLIHDGSRLRFNPKRGGGFDVLRLTLLTECTNNEADTNGLKDAAGEEQFKTGDKQYFRLGEGLKEPYACEVTTLEDMDGNGTIESEEIERRTVHYWDYAADFPDETGTPVTEFLFVERSMYDWFWQVWLGTSVNPERVETVS